MKLATILSRAAAKDSTIKTKIVHITPAVAEQLLVEFNHDNRPLKKGLVTCYANEMLRGKWMENGEVIIFGESPAAEEGLLIRETLISGQHRLHAMIQALALFTEDETAWPDALFEFDVVVVYGVDASVADSVDDMTPRKHKDVLFRSDFVDAHIPEEWNQTSSKRKRWVATLSTAARLVWQRFGGKTVSSATKFSNSECLQFLSENPELCNATTMVLNADDGDGGNKGLRKISLAYIAGLSYVAYLDADGEIVEDAKDKIDMFLGQVAGGTGYSAGSTAHALTGFWNSFGPGSKDRDLDISGPFVKALNSLLKDDKATPKKIALTAKEKARYRIAPPLLEGYDRACFEYAKQIEASPKEVEVTEVEESASPSAEE